MRRRLALLIATYEYQDTGLRRLTTPAHDAEALAGVLRDPAIAGFDVQTLVNPPWHEASEAIADFYAEGRRDDLTLLYFSGHGLKDDNGRLHLAMTDTKRTRLRSSTVPALLIHEAMTDSLSRQNILVLDCCYSGSYETQQFAKSDSAVHFDDLSGRGRTILTASDSTQYAFEGSVLHGEAPQSVFTRHLVAGLRDGTADLDQDGDITVDELYTYVFERVVAEQPNQRPKKFDQVEGRTILAVNVNWSLPDHLVERLASPFSAVRQAAVGELAEMRRSGNDLVRRTAHRRLEELVEDDSRSVSAAARAALDTAAPAALIPLTAPTPVSPPSPSRVAATARPTRQPMSDPSPVGGIGEAVGAALRRTADRLTPATVPLPIFSLSVLAAVALLGAATVGFGVCRSDSRLLWYLVLAAVSAVVTVGLQRRLGLPFVAGTTVFGVLGGAMIVGWATGAIRFAGSPRLWSEPVLAGLVIAGHAAWIGAGALALWRLRREGELTLDLRRLRGRLAWTLVGLGAVAALAQVATQAYLTYNSSLAFSLQHELRWQLPYPVALQIVAAELAIAGPLLAVPMRRGVTFLAGWMLAGFAPLVGVYGILRRIDAPAVAVAGLLAGWAVLAGVVIVAHRGESAVELAVGNGRRRFVVMVAAVLPVVLGGAVTVLNLQGPSSPIVVALAVGSNNDVLYAADSANDRVLKISTTTGKRQGDALEVGANPLSMVLAPDGRRLYVGNARGDSVSVIDVDAWKVLGRPIPVGSKPVELALSPELGRLYVLSADSASITVVDTEKLGTIGGPVSGGDTPSALAVGEDGKRLYVANHASSTVAVFDTATMRAARSPYKITGQPTDLSITRAGYLYVLSDDSYSIVNTNVDSPRPSPISLPGEARDAVLTDDDSRYVVLGSPTGQAGRKDSVTVIETKGREVIGTAESDSGLAMSVVISHDNQRAYLGGYSFEQALVVVDATTPKVVGAIALEK
ncbi:caspase family protein [Kribbella sp. NPDC056861]|uniref:caspase, EACC1-associated type n=1 Tax=Kribbella sp. NPDC056861 TaxID=3154857 RepID=UPI00343D13B6